MNIYLIKVNHYCFVSYDVANNFRSSIILDRDNIITKKLKRIYQSYTLGYVYESLCL